MTEMLSIEGLAVDYGHGAVLAGVDLSAGGATTLAVLGPSGCGKSTLLNAIAGLVPLAAGRIRVAGRTVVDEATFLPPERRGVAMVFQDFSLWPHLTVIETVAYPLRVSGLAMAKAHATAMTLLETLGISELAQRHPDALSGGQQQRVGLARALAREADVMLLDEPTAHLDAPLRATLQEEIRSILTRRGSAAVLATHDSAEALATADRVALLREGRLMQVGAPAEVYERPVDEWVARLTGSASVIRTATRLHSERVEVTIDGTTVTVVGGGRGEALVLRPEWVVFGGPFGGVVASVWYRGGHTDHVLDTSVGAVVVRVLGAPVARPGETVSWGLERVWLVD